jgi:hypothetical protein
MGDPAFQVEGHSTVGIDPFAVVFARNMHMRAGGGAALAGRMPDRITLFDQHARTHHLVGAQVEVKDHPTGAFIAVHIQVQHGNG